MEKKKCSSSCEYEGEMCCWTTGRKMGRSLKLFRYAQNMDHWMSNLETAAKVRSKIEAITRRWGRSERVGRGKGATSSLAARTSPPKRTYMRSTWHSSSSIWMNNIIHMF